MVSHPTVMRGLGATSHTAGPLLIKRLDDDFMAAAMREASDPKLAKLLDTRAGDHDDTGSLRLWQPVHRTFHLAMFEAFCDIPGAPRLDPDKIESAGFVVRRVASSARTSGPFGEAWMKRGEAPVGWRKIPQAQDTRIDPDPAHRALPDQGNEALNERIAALVHPEEQLAEDIVQMFVASTEVCEASGRTILLGLVPTVSSDSGEQVQTAPYDDDEIDAQIPQFLKAGKPPTIRDIADRVFTYASAEDASRDARKAHGFEPASGDSDALRASKQIYGFVQMLRVLTVQLDAFGDSKDAGKLREALKSIVLTYGSEKVTGDVFLANAANALVMSPDGTNVIKMPDAWPELTAKTALVVRGAFAKILQARFSAFAPRATRFDDPNARYRLTGFIRITRDDGCAPELVWSDPSPPYSVAPWYESSGAAPVLVRLPPINAKNVKKLKPNVSFAVPKGLFNMLQCNSPDDLIKGQGKDCGDFGLDWICGFNIPIITLCAFIVLYIFLTLFNIIFFWLPFIRICFPIPKKLPELLP